MIYKKIYETINDNLSNCKMKLPITETAACEIVGKNPYSIEIQEFNSFEKEELVEYAYYRCLNAVPDEKTYDKLRAGISRGKYASAEAARLYIVLKINESMQVRNTGKKIHGINTYCKRLYVNNTINKRNYNSLRLMNIFGKYNAVFGAYILYPLWMRLSVEKRQEIKKWLKRA